MKNINSDISHINEKLSELDEQLKQAAASNNGKETQIGLLLEKVGALESVVTNVTAELQNKEDEIQRVKERIATTVHDLKVPVTISLLNLELAEYEDDQEEKSNFFVAVRRELEFLVDTIGNTLDVAKAETGQFTLRKQDVELSELFQNILDRLAVLVKDRPNLKLLNEFTGTFPVLKTDRNLFTRVFNNLFSNAIKYTDEGEIALGGQVCEGTNVLELYVRDTGSGIEAEMLPQIFNFFQGDQARADSNGVGLSFVKNVVGAMEGKISIKSKKNKGTTVLIELPL